MINFHHELTFLKHYCDAKTKKSLETNQRTCNELSLGLKLEGNK